jgi:hypothetical protein
MVADLTYLHLYDNESNDEEPNEDDIEEPWVVNMGGLLTLDGISPNVEGEKDHNQPSISNAPTKVVKFFLDIQATLVTIGNKKQILIANFSMIENLRSPCIFLVCHIMALPFTLNNISRQKKNDGNSNISTCKNIILKKSFKRNQFF